VRDAFQQVKEACAYIGGPTPGTGYVVAPQRLATCHHVVKDWVAGERQPVWLGPGAARHESWVMKSDRETDCAILGFDGSSPAALPLAVSLERKAVWEGYGYPALANTRGASSGAATGLPLDGEILDSDSKDDAGRRALVLYSRIAAAGQASPLHGFSGSPVLVNGAVVGHLTKYVGDPDDRKRAAYGFVFACPVAAVRDLLDVAHPTVQLSSPGITQLADYIPEIPAGDFHVYVSYRSTDRLWALSLVPRLEGAGYKVFFDQREVVPGDVLAGQLKEALARSHSAIVLLSRGWLESSWCRAEEDMLVSRAIEEPAFRLVPARLDDVDMPAFLRSRISFDFSDRQCAEGPEVDRLLYALVGRTPPPGDTPSGRVETREARTIDAFVSQIKAAASSEPARVLGAVKEWRQLGVADSTPIVVAAEVLIQQNRPDLALDILGERNSGVRARQLRGLALAKEDRTAEAIQLLEQLRHEGELDPETGGLLAGRYKDQWRRSRDHAAREAACQLYRETYERTGDPFNGINAAAMALQCGDKVAMSLLASRVREAVEKLPAAARDHWILATLGEAYLLEGRVDEGRAFYRKAVARAAGRHENIAVMRRQARLNLEALGQRRDALDGVLPVPSIVAFVGHMVDAPDRATPRFPTSKVGKLRRAIRKRLQGLSTPHGFSSAARGSDILFIEELLRAGGQAFVILPFPVTDFLAISGGPGWDERFRQLRDRVELIVLRDHRPPDAQLPTAFASANREIQRRAMEYAARLDETPVAIAVWDRRPGDGAGGTADVIRLWKEEGIEPHVININSL
jgi:tetratricopeptide (TPR) repeat protein